MSQEAAATPVPADLPGADSMCHPMPHFERPQVKATLRQDGRIFLATEAGLFVLDGTALTELGVWQGQPVQYIAQAGSGDLVLVENAQGQALYRCGSDWRSEQQLALVPQEKTKALCAMGALLLAGTKSGIFRHADGQWQRLWGDPHGKGEVLWLRSDDGVHIVASVKKMGTGAKPALLESRDGGASWSVEPCDDYQDIVLAADGDWTISRWKGARVRGAGAGYRLHPASAGRILADGWAMLCGNTLEMQRAGQAAVALRHPILAEAEHLHLLEGHVLVAGVQGAYLLDTAAGRVTDLFQGLALPQGLGKIKRIFVLDHGVLLASATFGSFRSTDGGVGWSPVDSECEWSVLDAEHLERGPAGSWWLGCQRAVFRSSDNGLSWRQLPLRVEQHHYAELRGGIALLEDQVFIGTKTGLLASSLADPAAAHYVPAFEHQAIEALHTDADSGALLVGTEGGEVWRYSVGNARMVRLATAPVFESQIVGGQGHFLLATDKQVLEVQAGPVRDITPAEGGGGFGLAQHPGGRFVLWNNQGGWSGRVGSALEPITGWPAGVRHASLDGDGLAVFTTDRRVLRRIALPARVG